MTIAFSVCSNNYLAQAKTVLDSLSAHHPEIKTFVFLVDEPLQDIDYSFLEPAELIAADHTVVPGFQDMLSRYNLIELNSSVRPFIFQYLSQRFSLANRIYYLDPDMFVYDRFDYLDELLRINDIIITPHFLMPVPLDGFTPTENLALNYGVYNLGFLALNPLTDNVKRFLTWWGERTSRFGYADPANGWFVDQIWFNLVVVFFERVHALTHIGYNMACWNLHEREIMSYGNDGAVLLNSGQRLALYHFSLWSFLNPKEITSGFSRYNFSNRPDLVKLFEDYYSKLEVNGITRFRALPCTLLYRKPKPSSALKKWLAPSVRAVKKVWKKI